MKRMFLVLLLAAGTAACASSPTTDTVKQVLTQRWMSLRPAWAAERNVLFEEVRAAGHGSDSWTFRVTASVRDYGKGYPTNHYYGQTCVGRFENAEFVLHSNGAQWNADGAFTAPSSQCQPNPSDGVSSIPLQTLQGSAASNGPVAAPPAAHRSGGVAEGPYECWSGSEAQGTLNFTILTGGRYRDSSGKAGAFAFTPADRHIAFHGGSLDGGFPAGDYSIYYEPQGVPTVSIRNAGGDEIAFCQKR